MMDEVESRRKDHLPLDLIPRVLSEEGGEWREKRVKRRVGPTGRGAL